MNFIKKHKVLLAFLVLILALFIILFTRKNDDTDVSENNASIDASVEKIHTEVSEENTVATVLEKNTKTTVSENIETSVSVESEDFVKKANEMGKKLKEAEEENLLNDTADENVAVVNGEGISKQNFDNFVISSSYNELNQSKEELLNIMIEKLILRQKAEELGISVSEEEIEEDIERLKEVYEEDEDGKALMDAYMDGLEISFEELLDRNRKSLERDKKIHKLRKEILGEENVFNGAWRTNPEWLEFKEKCRENADIVIYME